MSITDELREWIDDASRNAIDEELILGNYHNLLAIADRIDIAHKHAIGYVDDRDPETMAENGWVKLPVDADGEYIHIGDRMENNERVARIVLTDESWEPSVYLEKLPNVLHEYFCNEISHYHAPTVEDVLRECIANVCRSNAQLYEQGCSPLTMKDIDSESDEYIAEYASKLRLAGEGA